jgi:hypothetical protein
VTYEQFRQSASDPSSPPPEGISQPLLALWHDAHGSWTQAHDCTQQDSGRESAWVHAYLHRKEGDLGNARYWYGCAGRKMPAGTLEEEWADMARALLSS